MVIPKDLDSIANRQEHQGAKVFFRALKMQYTELAKQFEKGQELQPNRDLIKNALISFHSRTQLEMADWQFTQLNKQVSVKALQIGVYERVLNLIRTWVTLNIGGSITSISNTTLDLVRKVIADGQEQGFGARKIGKLIRDEAKDKFTAYRSTVIARTEGTRAASHGAEVGAKQWESITGQKKWKAWSASADSRTRDSHIAMVDSKPIPGDEDFIINGKAMSGPGDPRGGKSEVISCRCRKYYMSERVAKQIMGLPQVVNSIQQDTIEKQTVREGLPDGALDRYKQYYKEHNKNIPDEEGAAIVEYTDSAYKPMNLILRTNEKHAKKDYYYLALANQVNKGLDKLPKYNGLTYRCTQGMAENSIKEYKTAFDNSTAYTEKAFLSSSPDLNPGFGNQVMFKIKSKNGVNITELSKHGHENEVLFKHGSQFKVTKYEQQDKTHLIIEMEEI